MTESENNKLEEIIPKTCLKWVGGKANTLGTIAPLFKREFNNYHEIFVGGGSVLFAVVSLARSNIITISGSVNAYDANEKLIKFYVNLRDHPIDLISKIKLIWRDYSQLDAKNREAFYYQMRNKFNSDELDDLDLSALFLFLNKNCYRGLYRENKRGQFNTSFGHYAKVPGIPNNLNYLSDLLQGVNLYHLDFKDSIERVGEGDFMYLDPPYAPETKDSFVKYTSNPFYESNMLFELIKLASDRGAHFAMSNSNLETVRCAFVDPNFTIELVECKRIIGDKRQSQTQEEILVTNYEL